MPTSFSRALAVLCASLCCAALASAPACAANATELRAEQLLLGANFLKDSLALTPNQLTLWQQTASRSATLLRARQSRREKMQAEFKAALVDPATDLRKLALRLDADNALGATEQQQLRESWLTVADALDERQRGLALQYIVTQLERVDQPERAARPEREQGGPSGGGRQKGGGPGGMGGMGGGSSGGNSGGNSGSNSAGSIRF